MFFFPRKQLSSPCLCKTLRAFRKQVLT